MPEKEIFNEVTLREEIVRMWGEYGAFVDVFDHMLGEIEKLRDRLDEAELSDIEARNPGINMEVVKAFRKARANALYYR